MVALRRMNQEDSMSRRVTVVATLIFAFLFWAAAIVGTTSVIPASAQSSTSTPTPTPMATEVQDCERDQCIFPCRGDCHWTSQCFTPPFDVCSGLQDQTKVTITMDACATDMHSVDAYLYDIDSLACPNGSGSGYLGGGNLNDDGTAPDAVADDGVWAGEFILEDGTVPDTVYLCWMGKTPNYWVEGADRLTINWECVSAP